MQADLNNYYDMLGVTDDTPISQIRLARRKRLAEVHPDRYGFGDKRRESAEEQAKLINAAYEGIRKIRANPQTLVKTSFNPQPIKPEFRQEDTTMRSSRKRLETVEAKVVVKNGKVVMIKKKRPVKYAMLKELRDTVRDAVLSTLDGVEIKLAERKAAKAKLNKTVDNSKPASLSKVVHIVEGNVSVESVSAS